MSDIQLQFLTTGVGVLQGPAGRVGFPSYADFRLVKRYLYGKLGEGDAVTNGEIETFLDWEMDVIQNWLDKVRLPLFHFRVFQKGYGSGLAVLAGPGTWWEIPNMAYLNLIRTRQLVHPRQVTTIPAQNEWDFVKQIYSIAGSKDDQVLEAIKALTPTQAQKLSDEATAARIPAKTEGVPEGITPSAS